MEHVQLGEERDVSKFEAANKEGTTQVFVTVKKMNTVKEEPLSLNWDNRKSVVGGEGVKISPINGSSLQKCQFIYISFQRE